MTEKKIKESETKFISANKKEVFLTQEIRKHLRPHQNVFEFLEEAISKASIPDRVQCFEKAVNLGRIIGKSLLVKTIAISPNEETDFSLRVGRKLPVRVSLNTKGEQCDSVTLEIKFNEQSEKYFLNTAYIGYPCPDSPYHILDRTSPKFKEALDFWCSHALAYDPKIMSKPFKASWNSVLDKIKQS